jgi:Subtilase family/Putative metal-binding motif
LWLASCGAPVDRDDRDAGISESEVARLASGEVLLARDWRARAKQLAEPRHWIARTRDDPSHAQRRLAEREGVRYVSRIEPGLWWVRVDPRAGAIDSLDWVAAGPPTPIARLDPALTPWAGRREIVMIAHPDVAHPAGLLPAGVRPRPGLVAGWIFADLTWDEAWRLAVLDGVRWVAPAPDGGSSRPLLDRVRPRIGADVVQGFAIANGMPTYANGGAGITIGVFDSGYTWPHPDFGTRLTTGLKGSDHATSVAGVIGGDGSQSDRNGGTPYQWRGIAPEATLISQNGAPHAMAIFPDLVMVDGMDLSNASLALDLAGQYDVLSASIDAAARGAAGRPHTSMIAAANNGIGAQYGTLRGYYATLTNAKNAVIVGDSYISLDHRVELSGMGPTWDGRLAPQIMAPANELGWPKDGRPIDVDFIRFEDMAGNVGYGLEFDAMGDVNGWKVVQNASDFAVAGGNFHFLSRLAGIVISPDNLPVPSGHTFLHIRFKVGGGRDAYSNKAVIEYANSLYCAQGCNGWAQASGGKWLDIKADGNWEEYVFQTGIDSIKWVRLFPHTGSDPTTHGPKNGGGYADTGGATSHATPVVSGSVALLLRALYDKTGRDQDVDPVQSATVRALLYNTAIDMVHPTPYVIDRDNPDTGVPVTYGPGPDYATGFGRLDIAKAVDAAQKGWWLEDAIHEGDVRAFVATVPPGATTLRATLVWDDPPADPASAFDAAKLVHDLDLAVVAGGKTYLPLVLTPPPHEALPGNGSLFSMKGFDPIDAATQLKDATPGVDHLNSVEQVVVDSPPAGSVRVEVRAPRSLPDGPWQRLSLVVNTPIAPAMACSAPSHEQCNGIDDDCNGAVDDGLAAEPETCDGLDDNCDGTVDEGCPCFWDRPCLTSVHRWKGIQSCTSSDNGDVYGACVPDVPPDFGSPADLSTPPVDATTPPVEGSGCSCSAAGARSRPGSALLLALLCAALAGAARRRLRRG